MYLEANVYVCRQVERFALPFTNLYAAKVLLGFLTRGSPSVHVQHVALYICYGLLVCKVWSVQSSSLAFITLPVSLCPQTSPVRCREGGEGLGTVPREF